MYESTEMFIINFVNNFNVFFFIIFELKLLPYAIDFVLLVSFNFNIQ